MTDTAVEPRFCDAGLTTPLGMVWLARSALGLCRVGIGLTEQSWRALAESELGELPTRDDAALAEALAALRAYFTQGSRQALPADLPLDLSRGTAFQQRVWRAARRIPYGQTRTYGQLAREMGAPGASRAVGQALHRNPVPIFVPCHRIVASGGAGGFALGLNVKRALLDIEGVTLAED